MNEKSQQILGDNEDEDEDEQAKFFGSKYAQDEEQKREASTSLDEIVLNC